MTATLEATTPLSNLVREIANEYPDGLRHPDFVRKVLEAGYIHNDDQPLSVVVHRTIKNLVAEGVLVKSEDEDRGIREYLPAGNLLAIA